MQNPLELYERILLKNPSEALRLRNSTFRGNGLGRLISLFDSENCFWVQSLSQLLNFSYELENDFKKSGKVLNKLFLNHDNSQDSTVNIMGPYYFPAESGSIDKLKFGRTLKIEEKAKMHFLKRPANNPSKLPEPGLINRTFDSSYFNNPSEKGAFNVSQLNGTRLLNINYENTNKISSFRRYTEFEEDYLTGGYSQPNVTSYNGQCPYFVNEKQYDAIIRRRRKKQKRMLLYGKSK
jgi:hypothetical protein